MYWYFSFHLQLIERKSQSVFVQSKKKFLTCRWNRSINLRKHLKMVFIQMYDTHLHFNSVNLDSMLLICSIWVTKTQPCMPLHHWMTSCQSLATKQSHRLHSSAETSTSLLTRAARSGWTIGGMESCGFEKWITEFSNFRNMLRWMNEFFKR